MKVVKFGGSSMADAGQYRKVRDILLADPDRRVVIVSAAGKRFSGDHKLTDLLYLCYSHVKYGVDCSLIFDMIRSRYLGIQNAVHGKRLGDIGYAVQQSCESVGYGVVREFVGHGIGKEMHEDPQVPNYGRRGTGPLLKSGMCLAIEPMITMGTRQIYLEDDGWSVRTRDGKCAAHFEHTVAVRRGKADILSSFEFIEEVLGDKAI